MDLSFSSRPQSLASSASLSPSSSASQFHLPSSIRREFLGYGPQLRPSRLLRSQRRCRRSNPQIQPSRCAVQELPLNDLVLVVAAAAAAAFAVLQVIHLAYNRRRRASPEFSDQESINVMHTNELRLQDLESKDKSASDQILGSGIPCIGAFSHGLSHITDEADEASLLDVKEEHPLKLQKDVMVHADDKLQPIWEFSPTENEKSMAEISGLNSLSNKVHTVGMMTPDNVVDLSDLQPCECEEAVAAFHLPEMITEPTISCFSVSAENKKNKINQDNELEHSTTKDGDHLVCGNDKLHTDSKGLPYCEEEKLCEMSTISCSKILNAEPLHLTTQDITGSRTRISPATRVTEVSVAGIHHTAAFLEQGTISRPKEVPWTREEVVVKVNDFANKRKGPMPKNDIGNVSGSPQPDGKLVKDEYSLHGYLRTYNRLLRNIRLEDCVDLLENMDRKGILDMDKVHHVTFMKACKSLKAVKEAFRFTKLIRKPTLSTFNMLLSICAGSQDFDGAFQVMLLVREAGLGPDCKLYTTLISTCAKCGKVDAMFEVFHEMVNAGVEPNVNTYGALIDGCARAGQVAKAFGAYGIMRSKNVQPDRVIFNALITACGQSGAVDRAFDVLAEMRAEFRPIDPDHVTVGALLKTCAEAGQVDRICEVYQMLHLYNIKGTPEVYTIAIRSCSRTGDLNFALSIYEDMKRNGVVPDEIFLSTLIDVAGHAGKIHVAFDILKDARTKGIQLGNVSYSSLMGACSNTKNWAKALELYEDIKDIKLLPTVSMLNALVTALCDGDQLIKSAEVLDEIKETGVHPNEITYSILIVACEKKGETELGLKLLEKAKRDGILPNLIMCRCLTGLCLQSFEKAKLQGELVVSFHSGRPKIDNKWASCSIMVYHQTLSAGVTPTIEVYSQVLGCLQFPHDSSLREKFLENIESSFDSSRSSNLCSLLDGFGEYDTHCFSILEEAASFGVVPPISNKDGPIVVDSRKLNIHTAEVHLLTILKSLNHRLAAGSRLPNITILLAIEKAVIESPKGERIINLAGRVGQALCSLLRRLGLAYQGDESYGKIRINGLTIRRWFKPKNSSSSIPGNIVHMTPTTTRLAKGIIDQQRSIRNRNLSLE